MELDEGDHNSCVPEHQRLRETKPSFDPNKLQGKVRYLTKSTDSDGSSSGSFLVSALEAEKAQKGLPI
jgi:hypothetical protein